MQDVIPLFEALHKISASEQSKQAMLWIPGIANLNHRMHAPAVLPPVAWLTEFLNAKCFKLHAASTLVQQCADLYCMPCTKSQDANNAKDTWQSKFHAQDACRW